MTSMSVVGQNVTRRDFPEKLVGQARYSADLKLPGMLYGQVLRSPHPHANIVSIDTEQAERLPGVEAIITPFNVPRRAIAPIAQDTSVLDSRVRFVGDEVAAVAAVDEDVARQALALIKVEYETLPFYTDPDTALAPGAVDIHPGGNLALNPPLSIGRGDVEQGLAEADFVMEETYQIACHSATPMEPRAALASWEGDTVTVWKSTRGVHVDQFALAQALDIPQENITMIGPFLGGGFGNKDESRLAALAALLSRGSGKTGSHRVFPGGRVCRRAHPPRRSHPPQSWSQARRHHHRHSRHIYPEHRRLRRLRSGGRPPGRAGHHLPL